MGYRCVIGLEIHVQLQTESKMFCSCSANFFQAEPNTNICPVCTAQPGALPVLNRRAVEYAVMTALALNCRVNEYSAFDRKNYFYPDLPKGYQITQYFHPLAENGYLVIEDDEGIPKKVRIRRIHMEEDAGKMFHQGDSITMSTYSLVDFNRCGVPLIEIVTEPDISTPSEARRFMEKLRSIVRYLGVSSGDMEKGALRCDANISVVDESTGKSSSRVEVKNINSFKFVEKALEYEYSRIVESLKAGEDVGTETRGWDLATKTTVSMRGKEEESDYRYFPEPDLPPLILSREEIEDLRKMLPELPDERKKRYEEQYSLRAYDASIIAERKEVAEYFEECVKLYGKPQTVANWIINEVLRELKEEEGIPLAPENLVRMLKLLDSRKISTKIAKDIFPEMFAKNLNPEELVKERGLEQTSDETLIENLVRKAIEENPKTVAKYKAGKTGVVGFFVGYVMRETKGKANPQLVNEVVRRLLDEA
ncbi:MAG: Asp-tRNA(Asn)/Glu-tRNA(Gln) amidotransferase subunit GatB [Thermotogae bacterium]|nr:Asp-tRNA(Asn)/Glu-tRNA(Gln) amidotransferase subunit GatB [Thermotogota bacterium]